MQLRVEAFDLGQPTSLSSDLDLTVFVTDVNDYAPEFTEDVVRRAARFTLWAMEVSIEGWADGRT